MSKIKNIVAERKTPDITLITWDIYPYVMHAEYKIYRSITGHGVYELIGAGTGNAFLDNTSKCRGNEYIEYKIESMGDTAVVQMYMQADKWLLGVAGEYLWQLEHASASTQAVAYCLGKSSNNCPECFSETLNKITKTTCSTCDGSGKLTSYVGPIPFKFSVIQVNRQMQNIGAAEKDSEMMSIWTGNIPLFRIGDIVITDIHEKYVVQSFPAMTTLHATKDNKLFIAKQTVTLKKIPIEEYSRLTYMGIERSQQIS